MTENFFHANIFRFLSFLLSLLKTNISVRGAQLEIYFNIAKHEFSVDSFEISNRQYLSQEQL